MTRCSALSVFFLSLGSAAFGAGELDHAYLIGTTDKHPLSYKIGEEMTFKLRFEGAKPFAAGEYYLDWTFRGDDGVVKNGKAPIVYGEPVLLKASLATNGFVNCRTVVRNKDGERYRRELADVDTMPEGKKALNKWEKKGADIIFAGAAAAEPEKLQSVPEPADYDAFWARHKAALAAVPMTVELTEHPSASPKARVYSFSIACAGPRPVTGTLTVPTKPGKYPAELGLHGYSTDYVQKPQAYPWHTDRLYMFINAHGYELGREDAYYKDFYKSTMSNGHTFGCDPAENADPETAYFSGMTYRIMRALEYLKSRPEWDGQNLTAEGGSMGGLQAIWAGALDPDVSKVSIYVPWCCDVGGRDTLHHYTGSSVKEAYGLRYYDPVNMARRIPAKTFVDITRAGFGDDSSTPSGIMIFWNNLRCRKSVRWVQGSVHGEEPPPEFREEYVCQAEPGLPEGEFVVEADFTDPKVTRAQRDFDVSLDLSRAAGVEFDFYCDDLSQFSGFPCYFKSGAGWYAGGISPTEEGQWTTLRLGKFSGVEGKPAGWDKIDRIRIAAGRAGASATRASFRVRNFRTVRAESSVLVVRGEACARRPGDGAAHLAFANYLQTSLRNVGVEPRQVSDESFSEEDLRGVSLVILPYNNWLPDGKLELLERFVAAGGKLFVCFTLPKGVEKLMGVRVQRFRKSGENGSPRIAGLTRLAGASEDLPAFVARPSGSAYEVKVLDGVQPLYDWASADGKSLGYPALVKGPAGYYMSYVWHSGESVSRDVMLKAILAECAPAEAKRLADAEAKRQAAQAADAAWVRAQPGKRGERRLAWIHSAYGHGSTAADWDETCRNLKAGGYTDVLANLCWGDTAFYASSVLREDERVKTCGDAFRAARAACDKYGLKLHVWLVCWNMGTCCTKARAEELAAAGRTQVSKSGAPLKGWLCPSHPENLRLEVESMVEAAKLGADGVHFDYVRYRTSEVCFCERCQRLFAERGGDWNDFRCANIDALVGGVAERLRRDYPKVEISAAVRDNAGNGAVRGVAQNWPKWCREGWLDFVCPMDYTSSPTFFRNTIRAQKAEAAGAKLFPGIGSSCWGGNIPIARRTAELVKVCREEGLGGFTVFEFSPETMPALKTLVEGPFRPVEDGGN